MLPGEQTNPHIIVGHLHGSALENLRPSRTILTVHIIWSVHLCICLPTELGILDESVFDQNRTLPFSADSLFNQNKNTFQIIK
jgi:hypothetical protein